MSLLDLDRSGEAIGNPQPTTPDLLVAGIPLTVNDKIVLFQLGYHSISHCKDPVDDDGQQRPFSKNQDTLYQWLYSFTGTPPSFNPCPEISPLARPFSGDVEP